MSFKRKYITIIFVCLVCLCFMTACGENTISLSSLSPHTYTHVSGYDIDIPELWQAETSSDGVYFINEDNTVAINIISELGGMSFYSPEELMELVTEEITEGMTDVSVIENIDVREPKYQTRQAIRYLNNANEYIANDIWLYEPMAGIRYYIVASCQGDMYEQYRQLFTDIVDSFVFTGNNTEVYELLNLSEEELDQIMKDGLSEK